MGLDLLSSRQPKFLLYQSRIVLANFAFLLDKECLINKFSEYLLFNDQLSILSEFIGLLSNTDKNIHDAFLDINKTFLRLVNATGGAVYYEGKLTFIGKTPSQGQIEDLIHWLEINQKETIFYTDSLSKLFRKQKSIKILQVE